MGRYNLHPVNRSGTHRTLSLGATDEDLTKAYRTFAAAVQPLYIQARSVAKCDIKMPLDESLGTYWVYINGVEQYLEKLKSVWGDAKNPGQPRITMKEISEFDREINKVWGAYSDAAGRFSENWTTVVNEVKTEKKGRRIVVKTKKGRFITVNVRRVSKLASDENDKVKSFVERLPRQIKASRDAIASAFSPLENQFNAFLQNFGPESKYESFERQLLENLDAQNTLVKDITNLDWSRVIKTYGTALLLGLGALTAVIATGGTSLPVVLPFLSGFIIHAVGTAVDWPAGYIEANNELDQKRKAFGKLIQEQTSIDYRVYGVLWSYVRTARVVLSGLDSASIILNRFYQENNTQYGLVKGWLDEISGYAEQKTDFTDDQVSQLETLARSLEASWNFISISKYLNYNDEKDSLYCFEIKKAGEVTGSLKFQE
ncbi:hypothetical protein Q8W82_08905 [Pseudomonas aeruginosa]|uniref:hypothetical protein n=1 Tax=Pseudomonas aeruginosa TaxID=287 RepID=UPI0029042091|nr:hypothetical protein [Pseudomonas aeruginosa]MDU0637394.1 hypothetical protein [Pseudomonas aeruginosa]